MLSYTPLRGTSATRQVALLATTALLLLPVGASAFSVVYPAAANHVHSATDTSMDATVRLNPDPIKDATSFTLSSVSQAMKDELAGGDTDFSDWTFDFSGAGPGGANDLAGVLNVDLYKAGFTADHVGGGEINLRFNSGMGDPANLRWIQLITTSHPLGGATSPYIDPFPNDADNISGAPFYYCDPPGGALCNTFNIANHVGGAVDHGFGTTYDLHFYDFSKRAHKTPLPFGEMTWHAELWLTSWDGVKDNDGPGGKEEITFHSGIEWGWTLIPEPGTGLLFGFGLALLASRRSARKARPAETV